MKSKYFGLFYIISNTVIIIVIIKFLDYLFRYNINSHDYSQIFFKKL